MKILTYTTLFPNNRELVHGVFVEARIQELAKLCELKVVAPVPYFPPIKKLSERYYNYSQVVKEEERGGLHIFHPRALVTFKLGKVFDGFLIFLSTLPTVLRIKKTFDFDLIDAHFAYPDGCAAYLIAKLLKKPVTVTIRGSDISLFTKYYLRRKIIKAVLRRVDKVIAVCLALKDAAVAIGISEEKIVVIPNGVNPERFFPGDKSVFRERLKLPAEKKILLTVANLSKRKGIHHLIDAVNLMVVKHKMTDILLIIIGGGEEKKALEDQIKRLNLHLYVMMTGAKLPDELREWYISADLFCLTSSREGYPNVLLESLACGTPVVATKVWGIPEVINSPDYGILVDSTQPQSLTTAIIEGLERNWDKKAIISYAMKNTWTETAKKVYAEFTKVVPCR